MKVFKVIFSIILCLVLWSAEVQAATISFNPVNPTVSLGSTFSMDIVGEGFPVTEGGGVNLYYNKDIVNVLTVTIDDLVWEFLNDEGTINNTTGNLNALWVASFDGRGPDFTVATIQFQAVGLGTTPLTMTEYDLDPWASGGSEINPLFNAGSVNVTAVIPEPASILLMGTGLAGMLRLARRKRP